MKTLTYPQPPVWSTAHLAFAEPEQWQPRKWVEQFTRQLRAVDLPTMAQRLLGGQQTHVAEERNQSLTKVGENQEPVEAVRQCVLIRHRGRQVLTAVRSLDNHLQLLSWRINANGSVASTGVSGVQPETITQLDIAHAEKFVVACRTATRRLKLISWDVSNTGAIYRAGESQEQTTAIHKVKIAALTPTLLMTAAVTATGQLQLTSWQLDVQAALAPLHQFTGDESLRELTLLPLPSSATGQQLLTVVRTRGGAVRLQVWHVTENGEISAVSQSSVAEASGTQIHAVTNEQGLVILSWRTPAGHLHISTWQISADGQQIEPIGALTERSERLRQQTLMRLPGGVVSAALLAQGRVQLKAWAIQADGAIVQSRSGAKTLTGCYDLTLCSELLDGNAPLLTGVRTAQGSLKLITWQG